MALKSSFIVLDTRLPCGYKMDSMPADQKIQIRCDQEFLEILDDWRARKRPILTRSAAIRHLVFRGALAEKHLAEILEQTANKLAAADLIGGSADRENYKRFQDVVIEILDHLARLEARNDGSDSSRHFYWRPDASEALETHDPDTDEQETPPNFRRVFDQSS